MVSTFSDNEFGYLIEEGRLARIATDGQDGTPGTSCLSATYNPRKDT